MNTLADHEQVFGVGRVFNEDLVCLRHKGAAEERCNHKHHRYVEHDQVRRVVAQERRQYFLGKHGQCYTLVRDKDSTLLGNSEVSIGWVWLFVVSLAGTGKFDTE